MKLRVYGWIEIVVVTLFVVWLAINSWPFFLPMMHHGTDTGGEFAAILLAGSILFVPVLMIDRLKCRENGLRPDPNATAVLWCIGIVMISAVLSTFLSQEVFSWLEFAVLFFIVIVSFYRLNVAMDDWNLPQYQRDRLFRERRILPT